MDHKKLIMYAHGSAYNHGCEAIVRSTVDLLGLEKEKTILFSNHIQGDLDFHLDDLLTLREVCEPPEARNSLRGILYRVYAGLHPNHDKAYYRCFGREQYQYLYNHGEVALSIGGDNYCYPGALTALDVRNYWLNKKGTKTILWGASLTEELLSKQVMEDLNRYALICVREQLSYDLLKKHGIRTELVVAPDPAFALSVQDTPWPDGKDHSNVVGINISHFATEAKGMENYRNLIRWILENTDMEIAMIPHVVFPQDPGNNDLVNIDKLLKQLPESDRIFVVDGAYNCSQLKSLISRCRFFVGARTHATIAAYSTCVPTLVVGYSTKSIGIARDLFGTEEGYVCSVQKMQDENMLLQAFIPMYQEENERRNHLKTFIPEYLKRHSACVDAVNGLLR